MAERRLDAIDDQLLALLEQNARAPIVTLAKKIGLSRSATQDRLAKLEDQQFIKKYTIVRGGSANGVGMRSVLLMKIDVRPCEQVLRQFRDWPEVLQCWSVASPLIDAVLVVETADAQALGDLRERLAELPGAGEITTAPVLRTVIERAQA